MSDKMASIMLLRRLTVADIERDGPTSSVMVRSGLLLEIIDMAIAKAIEAQRAETAKTGSVEDESAVAESDLPERDEHDRY